MFVLQFAKVRELKFQHDWTICFEYCCSICSHPQNSEVKNEAAQFDKKYLDTHQDILVTLHELVSRKFDGDWSSSSHVIEGHTCRWHKQCKNTDSWNIFSIKPFSQNPLNCPIIFHSKMSHFNRCGQGQPSNQAK